MWGSPPASIASELWTPTAPRVSALSRAKGIWHAGEGSSAASARGTDPRASRRKVRAGVAMAPSARGDMPTPGSHRHSGGWASTLGNQREAGNDGLLSGGRRSLRDGLSEQLVDPFHQLPGAEGLRDVVVRAHVESELLVYVPSLRGEEDHRNVLGRRARLDVLADLVAVELRHHDVQHDEIGLLGLHLFERLFSIERGDDLVALHPQTEVQDVDDVDLVVDDQDLPFGHPTHLLLDMDLYRPLTPLLQSELAS